MGTISGTINQGITLGTAGAYASPLTITAAGYVNNTATTGDGIYGPNTQAWQVLNYGRINEAGNGTAQAGIYLTAGGTIINGTSASISGAVGVWTNGQPGTIDNSGTIAGRNGAGILLQGGGSVVNKAGGTVVGRGGVRALSAPATIINAGQIGNPKYAFGAIYLGAGGTVVNQMGGTIGSLTGFYRYASRQAVITASNAPATIINAGSISANGAYYAIHVTPGSSVVNQAGGRITTNGFAINAGYRTNGNNGPVYISNAGYVAGYGGQESGGVILSPAGTLVNQAGATIKGGFAGALFFAGTAGSVGASGTIINAGTITGEYFSVVTSTDSFGTVVNSGTLSAGGSASVLIGSGGVVLNQAGGTIMASGTNPGTGFIRGNGTSIGIGVILYAGGTVINAAGGYIGGKYGGVKVYAGNPFGPPAQAAAILNYGRILDAGNGTAQAGIYLTAGGTVINGTSASISGATGVWIAGQAGTVNNSGTITGHGNAGISLQAGGSVTNQVGGTISGDYYGVLAVGPATIDNVGHITGSVSGGVGLRGGGVVLNQSGGRLDGLAEGVLLQGAAATLINAGTVGQPLGLTGVNVSTGGTVINQSGGLITGFNDGIEVRQGTGYILNGGQISGAGMAAAISFFAAAGTVVNQAGGTIKGSNAAIVSIPLGGTSGSQSGLVTVINAGSITAARYGMYISGGGVVINQATGIIGGTTGTDVVITGSIGTVVNAGTLLAGGTKTTGIILRSGGTIVDSGLISAAGGTAIAFGGSLANRLVLLPSYAISGNVIGSTTAGAGNTLELGSAVAAGHVTALGTKFTNFGTLAFDTGATWTAEGSAAGIPGAIIGFTTGDTIDVDGFVAVGGTFANNALVLTDSGNNHATLGIRGSFSTGDFTLTADGASGTDIGVRPRATWIAGSGNWNTGADWSTGSPPAPTGNATIANGGTVSITTPITVNSIYVTSGRVLADAPSQTITISGNVNRIEVDSSYGPGGTNVRIGGTLGVSFGVTSIGNSGGGAPTTVTAQALAPSSLNIAGSTSAGGVKQAALYIATPAAGAVQGNWSLYGDALLEFASGSFTSIEGSQIFLSGPQARIANASDPLSNSALSQLSSNDFLFSLNGGATAATDAGVDFLNSVPGQLSLESFGHLSIGGTLTNTGAIWIDGFAGNGLTNGVSLLTAAGLNNTGAIHIRGDYRYSDRQAEMIIQGPAPSTLQGLVQLSGPALLEFNSGSINAIASGATVEVYGANAQIAIAGDTHSNSGLFHLRSNAGTLDIESGAAVKFDPAGTLTNSSIITVDYHLSLPRAASNVAFGTLVNTNKIIIESTPTPLSTVMAVSLFNSGNLELIGSSSVIGPVMNIAGGVTNSGSISVDAGSGFTVAGSLSGAGTISNVSAGLLELDGAVASGQTITLFGASNLTLADPTEFAGTISGLGPSHYGINGVDLINISNSSITSAVLDTSTDQILVSTSANSTISLQLNGTYAAGTSVQHTSDASGSGTELTLALCFCRGTMILTDRGEIAVEYLAVGDRAATLSGEMKPIVWIGMGRDLVTPANRLARPVIVRRGALADNVPSRDLYLTHGHALYLHGVLIAVEHLINHQTILWDDTARVVEYYHIELEDHDAVWANGAAAETYYDAGNRALFQNVRAGSAPRAAKPTFAPVETSGEIVERIWAELYARAGTHVDVATTRDPDLHLVVDGSRLDAVSAQHGVYVFALERAPDTAIQLRSRCGVPSLLGLNRHEHRRLGIALRRIVINARGIMTCLEVDAPLLAESGCHPAENGFCWTDGAADLPPATFASIRGRFTLLVHISDEGMRYPCAAPNTASITAGASLAA